MLVNEEPVHTGQASQPLQHPKLPDASTVSSVRLSWVLKNDGSSPKDHIKDEQESMLEPPRQLGTSQWPRGSVRDDAFPNLGPCFTRRGPA